MGLCALIYVLLLIFNRKRCFSFVSGNKVSVVMILYLLTIGLTVTPTVNAVMIVIVLLSAIFQKKKMNRNVYMSRGSFILILLVSTYLILNTIIIYSNKKYNPEFNPYIGLIEMITYFLYFIASCRFWCGGSIPHGCQPVNCKACGSERLFPPL